MGKPFPFLTVLFIVGLFLAGCSSSTTVPVPTNTHQVAAPTSTALPTAPTAVPDPETATSTPVDTQPTVTPTEPTPTEVEPTPTEAEPTPIPATPTPEAVDVPLWSPDGAIGTDEYDQQTEIAGVTFRWTTDDTYLYGAMLAATDGWVAIGFDPESMMKGANFIFGYVQDGQTFIEDMFGTRQFGQNSHPPDTELGGSNDIVAYGGREENGTTVIEFQIPLASGDANDRVLSPGTHALIAAFGGRDDFTSIHAERGSGTIEIRQ